MKLAISALLVLGVAVFNSKASPSNNVRYNTPSAQVSINWNGASDNDNDGQWGSSGWRTGSTYGSGWAPSTRYGPPKKHVAYAVQGHGDSSSEEDGGDGGNDNANDGDNNNDNTNDNMDNNKENNQDGGEGQQAEISIKTVPGKDGKIQREIDIELTIDGESKTMDASDIINQLMDALRSLGSSKTTTGTITTSNKEAPADQKEIAMELAEIAAEAAADKKETAMDLADLVAEVAADKKETAAEAGATKGAVDTTVDLMTADLSDIADILKANNINSDLKSLIELARKELGAATKTELEVVQGSTIVGATENADAKAEAAQEAAEPAMEVAGGAAEAMGIAAEAAAETTVDTADAAAAERGLDTELTAPRADAQQGETGSSNWDQGKAKTGKGGKKRPSYDGFSESFLRFDWGQDDRANDKSIRVSKSKVKTSKTVHIEPSYSGRAPVSIEADLADLGLPEIGTSVEDRVPVYETPIVKEYRAPLYRDSHVIRSSYRPVVDQAVNAWSDHRYGLVGQGRTVFRKPVKTVVHHFSPAPVQLYRRPTKTVKQTRHHQIVYSRPRSVKVVKQVRRPSYSSGPLVDFDDLW